MSPLSKHWLLTFALCTPALAGVAHAADTEPAHSEPQSITSYRFDDDLVRGDTVNPDVWVLQARTRGARDSLVRARLHFVNELCKSVEQL